MARDGFKSPFPSPAGEDWFELARCRGPEGRGVDFFPVRRAYQRRMETTAREREALAVCAACPARDECLGFALQWRVKDGIWGGTLEAEREKLLRERRRSAALAASR